MARHNSDYYSDSESILSLFLEGWEEHVDQDTGRPYYYNTYTKQSQWEKPALSAENYSDEYSDSEYEIPHGWEECVSQTESPGRTFYANMSTGEAEW